MDDEKKYQRVLEKINEILKEEDYELVAMPIITPDGRVLARPVLGPRQKDDGGSALIT